MPDLLRAFNILSMIFALACAFGCSTGNEPRGATRYHVVIFLIDTLRADYLGCYGTSEFASPHIDALASRGVLFEQANSPAPWTVPSVASLMLSQFPAEHGVVLGSRKIAPDAIPLALRLRRAGYATVALIRNPSAGRQTGLDLGFDVSELALKPVDGPFVASRTQGVERDRPLFLYLHNTEPHNPFQAHDRFIRPFGQVTFQEKERFRALSGSYRQATRIDHTQGVPVGTTDNTDDQRRLVAELDNMRDKVDLMYRGSVREADENVGSVIQFLKDAGQWQETVFILVADHGEEMGEHGMWQHDQSVYEELIRVPMIIRFPGDEFAGRRVSVPVSLVDLMPTLADYLDLDELAVNTRGRSLLPLLSEAGDADTSHLRVTSMRHNFKKYYRPNKEGRGDLNVVVREGMWKGIWNADVGSFELYDLEANAREQQEQSASNPERVQEMRRFAEGWLRSQTARPEPESGKETEDLDPAAREMLRDLGYVE